MATTGTLAEARAHNVPPEVFLRHYREIRDLKDAHAETGTAVARAKKAAKAAGIDLDALKMLEKLADLDTDEAEMQLSHLQIYAKWIELPVGMQGNFFGQPEAAAVPPEAAAEQAEWDASDGGKQAGAAGHARDTNPYPPGSGMYVAWDKSWSAANKAWLKGQKKIAGEMGPKAGNGAAASRKRGRPRNGAAEAML